MTQASKSQKPGRKRKAQTRTFGEEMIRRLRGFSKVLKKGDNLSKHYKVTTYQLDLQPVQFDAAKVKALRVRLGASQAAFAQFIGVGINTVRSWEQGASNPNPIACRFMDEMDRDPDYWIKRIDEAQVRQAATG